MLFGPMKHDARPSGDEARLGPTHWPPAGPPAGPEMLPIVMLLLLLLLL